MNTRGIAFGYLENVAFGALDFADAEKTIDTVNQLVTAENQPSSCLAPANVVAYANAPYGAGKLDFTLPEVKAYEACATQETQSLLLLTNGFSDTDAAVNLTKIGNIDALLGDVNNFKNYLQTKMQILNGWTTPQFMSWYYAKLFNDYPSYQRAMTLANAESATRQTHLIAMAKVAKAQVGTQISTQYLDLYTTLANKYGPKMSLAEQKRLQDFFVNTTVPNWSLQDFLDIGTLLSEYLNSTEMAQYYSYIPMAVTGYYFAGSDGSATDYMNRVKAFTDAAQNALKQSGTYSSITLDQASAAAQSCNNDAACIANYFTNGGSSANIVSAPTSKVVKAAITVAAGFFIYKALTN